MDTLLGRDEGPEMAALWSDARRQLRAALATLKPREERILRLRFGLDGVGEHTYEACDLSVSRERVRQIEQKALRKLRHQFRPRKLSCPWTSADEKEVFRKHSFWIGTGERVGSPAPQVKMPAPQWKVSRPQVIAQPPPRTPIWLKLVDLPVFFTSDLIRQAEARRRLSSA